MHVNKGRRDLKKIDKFIIHHPSSIIHHPSSIIHHSSFSFDTLQTV